MTYRYQVQHEAIVLGTTTIESTVELTPEQVLALFKDYQPLPGDFVSSSTESEYPLMYGACLSLDGKDLL